jgi:hypothetical protein
MSRSYARLAEKESGNSRHWSLQQRYRTSYIVHRILPRNGKTSLPALAQSRVAWGLRPHPPATSLEPEVRFHGAVQEYFLRVGLVGSLVHAWVGT